MYWPELAAPVPAAMLAQWVPWPNLSLADSPVKDIVWAIFEVLFGKWKSGWVGSMPVSRMAIFTPEPLMLLLYDISIFAQSDGSLIIGTLWSRFAWNLRSSHTWLTSGLLASLNIEE